MDFRPFVIIVDREYEVWQVLNWAAFCDKIRKKQEVHMIANYHTHTWRCNHAQGKEDAYVRCAIERGLEVLGFSDHSPYIFPNGYVSSFRMGIDQLDDYVETVLSLRRTYEDRIQIPLGLELEYYPSLLPELLAVLRDQPIEYLLLGQHYLGNEIGEHYNGKATDDTDLLKRYCYQSMDAMNTGLFTYFAHPDLFHYTGDPGEYKKYMRQLCKEANACRMPLEFNLLGFEQGRNYPTPIFWEIAAEEQCRVIMGCDAHRPEALQDVGIEERALAYTQRYDFDFMDQVALRSIR